MTPDEMISKGVSDGLADFSKAISKWLIFSCVFYVVIMYLGGSFDRDSTDGVERSGMVLRTDYGTGCQYLESSKGGITPRLNVHGQQVGCVK